MNRLVKTRFLLAALGVFMAAPTAAQDYQSAVGLTLGGSVHGDLTPGLPTTTRFEPGWIAGLQYEQWFGSGWTGVRVNTLFTQRLLDASQYRDYNVFVGDVDLLVRLLPPDDGHRISPFFAFGAGATHYGGVAGTPPIGEGVYGDRVVRAHLLTSVGMDIAASGPAAVRFELGDKIVLPSIGYGPSFSGFPNVHNLLATIGLQYRFAPLWRRSARSAPVQPEPVPQPEQPRPDPSVSDEVDQALNELESRVAAWGREVTRLELQVDELEDRLARRPEPARAEALYTVQVGSFLEPERANRLVEELRSFGVPVWRWDTLAQGMTFSRVRVGAVTSETEAERLATLLQRDQGLPVWVDEIEEAEAVPGGAVAETRAFLDQAGG